ncbi:MAG: flagellar hook-length control protein FliK, partial [Spirochaetaceae bacterium]
ADTRAATEDAENAENAENAVDRRKAGAVAAADVEEAEEVRTARSGEKLRRAGPAGDSERTGAGEAREQLASAGSERRRSAGSGENGGEGRGASDAEGDNDSESDGQTVKPAQGRTQGGNAESNGGRERDSRGSLFERLIAETDANRGSERSAQSARRSDAGAQLGRQLREAHPEIVKHARLLIRGERGGEIRLHLKPESLGSIRIRLHLQDNHIAGRIIVENSSVREAFEQTLGELERAFHESGIETGELEVTVEEREGEHLPQQASKNQDTRAVQALEESVPLLAEIELDNKLVDLIA